MRTTGTEGAKRRVGHAEVFAAICALSFAAARTLPLLDLGYRCPFLAMTGLPCATCGMTHAFVHLAHGELAAAFAASPLGAILAAGAWVFALLDLVRWIAAWPLPSLGARGAAIAARLAAVALMVNWAWLVLARHA